MIIKDERQSTLFLLSARRFFLKYANHLALLAVVLIGFVICIPNLYVFWDLRTNDVAKEIESKKSAMQKLIKETDTFGPLYLDIKQKSFQKLEYARKNAIEKTYITDEEKQIEVKGLLRDKTLELPVTLRFKGDLVDHLESDQWSFRIKVKDGKFFRGMKEFSIQHPKVRNYLAEYIFNLANKQENILTHRYDFVVVERNNTTPKLYAIEEHFTKQLIENSRRREGPILKFDESLWWRVRHNWKNVGSYKNPAGAGDYFSLDIDAFSLNKIKKDPLKYKQYQDAYGLLEAFRSGEKEASEVFVVDKMAKFLALSDLFGAYHGLALNQARFYFNPILAKLEPIPFDANAGGKLEAPIGAGDKTIFNLINITPAFEDPIFMRKYIAALNEVSQTSWLEEFRKSNELEINQRETLLSGFFPSLSYPWEQIQENGKRIREFLEPLSYLRAQKIISSDNKTSLAIANIHSLPIEVTKIKIGKQLFTLKEPLLLRPRSPNSELNFQEINIGEEFSKELFRQDSMQVGVRLLGMNELKEEKLDLQDLWLKKEENPMRLKANYSDFPFITLDKENSVLTIPSGTSIIKSSLIIPAGFKLKVLPGANIVLKNNALLITYSPIEALGTREDPISFSGMASNPTHQGGIIVANTQKQISRFDYVTFENLGAPKSPALGWELMGSINFHKSDVIFSNSVFRSNVSGDDTLNIIRSNFTITESIFENSLADALDVDFGEGELSNCEFINSGNDSVDISGTKLKATQLKFRQVGDKAISVGERSNLIASHLDINQAKIGIGAKDGSSAEIDHLKIQNTQIGFVSLQKKPEYSPAKIKVINGEIAASVNTVHEVEVGSLLILNGTEINGKLEDLRSDLY